MTNKEMYKVVEEHVVQNKERLYRIAYSFVKNQDNALDIVQESVYKALRSIDQLDHVEHVRTWFYRIVVNTALDFVRKNKKIVYVDDTILENNSGVSEDAYANLDLHAALDQLSPAYKTVIILKYFEDLTFEDIANVLGENVNTVKTRLYAGLKKLRIEMEKDQLEGYREQVRRT